MNHPSTTFKKFMTPDKKRDNSLIFSEPKILSNYDGDSQSTDNTDNYNDNCCSKWNWEVISPFSLPKTDLVETFNQNQK